MSVAQMFPRHPFPLPMPDPKPLPRREPDPVTPASIQQAIAAARKERVQARLCPICATPLDASGWCPAKLCICWFDPSVAHLETEVPPLAPGTITDPRR